jgi:hypothetical protein
MKKVFKGISFKPLEITIWHKWFHIDIFTIEYDMLPFSLFALNIDTENKYFTMQLFFKHFWIYPRKK